MPLPIEAVDASDARAGFFTYETISYDSRLTVERQGRVARFERRQLVRFLDDDIGVFFDRIWGDGVILADYDPGSAEIMDAIPTRKGYVVALTLPRRFRQNETYELSTVRTIVGGFADRQPFWELTMSVPAKTVTLGIETRERGTMKAVEAVIPNLVGVAAEESGASVRLTMTDPTPFVPYRLEWRWD